MSNRFLPVSLFAVAIFLGACGSSSTSSSSSTTTSTGKSATTSTTSTSSPPSAKTTSCKTSDLTITVGPSQGAAGHVYIPILFQNTGASSCTINGFPQVAGTNSSGQQVAQAAHSSGTPSTVVLPVKGFSSATLTAINVPSGNETSCTNFAGLNVTPPDNTTGVSITVQTPGCAGLSVSPVVAGTSGQ